jgi:hypothetical protein
VVRLELVRTGSPAARVNIDPLDASPIMWFDGSWSTNLLLERLPATRIRIRVLDRSS